MTSDNNGDPQWPGDDSTNPVEPDPQSGDIHLEQAQEVATNLDPKLQDVILSLKSGKSPDPAVVQESDEGDLVIEVLAVLRDPQQPVPGLRIVRVIGDVVTGTVAPDQIESVRYDPNVRSLKAATRIESSLHISVPEVRATQQVIRDSLPQGTRAIDGSGIIVGIIDFGCDFAHRNFRKQDGATRILFLWDQNQQRNSMTPAGFDYGREFTSVHINRALQTASPYVELGYNPGNSSHGTHVMDIAAGNGLGTGVAGVAPKADIIFVELSGGDFSEEESFGNSRRLLEAADYIFEKARHLGRPAVINMSLGTHGGPHDGSTPAERGLDLLVETAGRAIVISAGNSWERRSHASGKIRQGQRRTLRWEKFSSDQTGNEAEVWYSGASRLEVTLVLPGGERLGPVALGATSFINRQGQRVGRIVHRQRDPLNGDNQIDILLGASLPIGVWGIELAAIGSDADFHAWIERDDDRSDPFNPGRRLLNQSKFVTEDNDSACTVGSISCGKNTIVVGSYDASVMGRDVSSFSSEGPTRDGKRKPEVSAPGHGILAAASSSATGRARMSGTSMAAPHVTGVVALLMQAAGRPLAISEIRNAVINSIRSDPPAAASWNSRYGHGRIDAVKTVLTQISHLPSRIAAEVIEGSKVIEDSKKAATNSTLLSSVTGLIDSLVKGAGGSRIQMRIELEIVPPGGKD
jgi:subtilisin family serine protease